MAKIVSITDPDLDRVLDIYQQSFPMQEQMPVSFFTRKLRLERPTPADGWLYAAKIGGEVAGFTSYLHKTVDLANFGQVTICWLYYIALASELRNSGWGREIYKWLVQRASSDGCLALFYEVERPDHSPDADMAKRRLKWYQRNGAKRLGGVRYTQSVGWQPPLEMDILIHPLQPMGAIVGFETARALVGDSLEQIGSIELE